MQYNYRAIEKKWQSKWKNESAYRVNNDFSKPKCYVLDMFPYPSGAGLHVGHPLGYIASDIYARYKRLKGFNVLHPMGFDAFGLPAEQYAIETGQHPAVTTEKNIARYKEQLDNIGFSFDWSREVRTADPAYYKWTQWIFLQLYNSWYNPQRQRAEPIATLLNTPVGAQLSEAEIMQYRLAYRAESYVNWCEALGTVLANDEVVNGVSERGGHPVERRQMSQWFLRITAYAERLLEALERVDYPESLKEMQRNWIGKSEGAEISFSCHTPDASAEHAEKLMIRVFTTRPDTLFGVSFMVLAPEHDLTDKLTTAEQKAEVEAYKKYVSARSERERLAETKSITGAFTGAYAVHPFTGENIPIWISEYVLAGYGTGAIMAVPCGDERDHAFARHFNLPIPNIFRDTDVSEKAYSDKNVIISNSGFLNDLPVKEASAKAIAKIEEMQIGVRKINYRMRDAGFSRQRYWGEPFPIIYDQQGLPQALSEDQLPLELPHLETYSAGPQGKGPLANATAWVNTPKGERETDTMPGYAGSSWYYLRYMDPHNSQTFCDRQLSDYWQQVDVYVGGAEHAVGHLLYSRMWCKALFDLGYIGFDEPYKKLINQGMIQGKSKFIYMLGTNKSINANVKLERKNKYTYFISKHYYDNLSDPIVVKELKTIINNFDKKLIEKELENIHTSEEINIEQFLHIREVYPLNVDINLVNDDKLDIQGYIRLRESHKNFVFICEDGTLSTIDHNSSSDYVCGSEVEKMSKSKYNVVNPDDIIEQYGTDTFRMYEMFLGPLEVSKPWDTQGIEGVHRFLKKFWRLYVGEDGQMQINEESATAIEQKILHQTIKKVAGDIEHFAFNTSVSQLMICCNELGKLNCKKREILEPLLIVLNPFAPHISAELWQMMGNETSILDADFPQLEEKYLVENVFRYPVAINGKTRLEYELALDLTAGDIEKIMLSDETVKKWMEGKPLKKLVFVPGRMINMVV